MDDIVAVEVELSNGESRHFLTWGRIQDQVDPTPLEALIMRTAHSFSLGAEPVATRVLPWVGLAASAPAFYECFFGMAQKQIPFGDGYEAWRHRTAEAMESGREIWYLGRAVPDGESKT